MAILKDEITHEEYIYVQGIESGNNTARRISLNAVEILNGQVFAIKRDVLGRGTQICLGRIMAEGELLMGYNNGRGHFYDDGLIDPRTTQEKFYSMIVGGHQHMKKAFDAMPVAEQFSSIAKDILSTEREPDIYTVMNHKDRHFPGWRETLPKRDFDF